MKLIVGLGNPGDKYKNTRHNAGYIALDALMRELESEQLKFSEKFEAEHLIHKELILIKPQTFMNNSGKAVKSLAAFYKVPANDIYVIHDDLDLKLGDYKIQKGIGPKVHGGINSIEEQLHTKDFWRVRIGVDNRGVSKKDDLTNSAGRVLGEEYVLQNFNNDEFLILEKVIHKVVNDLDSLFV